MTGSIRTRILLAALATAALTPVIVAGAVPETPRTLADCNDVVESTDSFSMDCAPSVIPNTSDPLTEAEVAQPGWNAVPGGDTGVRR